MLECVNLLQREQPVDTNRESDIGTDAEVSGDYINAENKEKMILMISLSSGDGDVQYWFQMVIELCMEFNNSGVDD